MQLIVNVLMFMVFKPYVALAILWSIIAYYLKIAHAKKTGLPLNRVPWLIFLAVIGLVIFAQYHAHHNPNDIAATNIVYFLGIAAVLLLVRGTMEVKLMNIVVASIAALALVLWFFTTDLTAIVLSLVAVAVGTVPLWQALRVNPRAEPRLAWLFWGFGSIAEFAAQGPVHTWHINDVLPIYVFFGQQVSVLALSFLPPARTAVRTRAA